MAAGSLHGCRDMRSLNQGLPADEWPGEAGEGRAPAWSVPYFIPGGSDFLRDNAQPAMTVRGAPFFSSPTTLPPVLRQSRGLQRKSF